MQAIRRKHVRTFLTGYRSGGTPCVFTSRGACWNCRPSTREQCLPSPRQPPSSSCCLSLLAGGFRLTTHSGSPVGPSSKTTPTTEMTGAQDQAPVPPVTKPVTYEELTPEHKQKYDEVKAQFETDLIGSFERTRNHSIRWKGFSPEGAKT